MTPEILSRCLEGSPVPSGRRLVVAVSGGADSTALVRLLVSHRSFGATKLIAAHVNYHLRGDASDRDERFVCSLCRSLRLPLRVLQVRRPPPQKRSLQDWARETRYGFFARVAKKERAWGVAIAHHLDDQAETVLDRLLRGTGLRGLGALRPVWTLHLGGMPLKVYRPLLSARRGELEDYLRRLPQDWRKDASNQKTDYRRNRIRHELLPTLRKFNPRVDEALAHLAEVSSAEDVLMDALSAEALKVLGVKKGRRRLAWDAKAFAGLDVALQRRTFRLLAEDLNPEARGLRFERLEEGRQVFLGRLQGPRDLGGGLVACREGSSARLSLV